MDGFLEPLKRKEIEIKNSKILMLRCRRSSKSHNVAGFQKENAKEITIVNRTKEKEMNWQNFQMNLD